MTRFRLGRKLPAALVSLAFVTLAFAFATTASPQKQAGLDLPGLSRSFVMDYCAKCHDAEMKKGDLDLETICAQDPATHPEVWEKVVRKLRVRQMPPADKKRPDEK